uniref:Uncharacterized protein n=1 Tax=Setaria italica TaxID=4555 RepID=K3YKH4_SETIT
MSNSLPSCYIEKIVPTKGKTKRMPYAQTKKGEQDYPAPSLISLLTNLGFDLQALCFHHGGKEGQLVSTVHRGVDDLLGADCVVRRCPW